MKLLNKKDLNKVDPYWREKVEEALNNGEKVPYGVVYLAAPKPLTEKEIEYAKRLVKNLLP